MIRIEDFIRYTPKFVKKLYSGMRRKLKRPKRLLPNFIIIGAQKSGTSSLYKHLIAHPIILPAWKKEPHFFDFYYHRGLTWYRGFFPTLIYKKFFKYVYKKVLVTCEATPFYILHPHACKRIYTTIPHVKLIIILRNPVDRAYSHYQHSVRHNRENLTFEEAIEKEQERIRKEMNQIIEDKNYYSPNLRDFSYLTRGIYIDQIKKWFQFFPKNQILIINSEDYFSDSEIILKEIYEFLKIPNLKLKKVKKFNIHRYQKMNALTRKQLIEYFKPHNRRLYDYLGRNFDWDK